MSGSARDVSGRRATAWVDRAFARHGQAVACFAYHLTGDHDEAERLTVAAFQEAHRMRANGQRVHRPRVWLLRYLNRVAPILPRDRRGEPVRVLPDRSSLELTTLRGQLWRLPLAEQSALVLSRWCGLPVRETAAVLGMHRRDVRQALRSAEGKVQAPPRSRRARRAAAGAAVGASMAVAAAQVRSGGAQALASSIPGSTGAAGMGSLPVAAALSGKLAVAAVVTATAVGMGATISHELHARHHAAGPTRPAGIAKKTPSGGGSGRGGAQGSHRPKHPATSHKPAKQGHSKKPKKPAKQGHPTKPEHPTHPTHPTHPAHPTHPTHPTRPSEPAHPTHPAHPSTP